MAVWLVFSPETNGNIEKWTSLLADLTEREREVVALAGCGLSNDEIAQRLVISPATARTHVSRSVQKLGVRDRAQLMLFACGSGLASPGQALPYASRH